MGRSPSRIDFHFLEELCIVKTVQEAVLGGGCVHAEARYWEYAFINYETEMMNTIVPSNPENLWFQEKNFKIPYIKL